MAFKWFGLSGGGKVFEFRCADCSEIHRGSPSFAYKEPPLVANMVPDAERQERLHLTSDMCVIDDEVFFIRCLLEIPILGVEEPFAWGVWMTQSEESFLRYQKTFGEDQSGEGSFGWLGVTMPGYAPEGAEDGQSLACDVVWQGDGNRPLVHPHECDHQLYHDHVQGISWDRAIELARKAMHG